MAGPMRRDDPSFEWDPEGRDEEGFKGNGAKLFQRASSFFFFCMSQNVVPPSDRHFYSTLSKIMQISKHSALYGNYIEDGVENSAAEMLSDLKEALKSGTIPRQAIATKLQEILSLLSEESRKAALMITLTELEIFFMGSHVKASDVEKRAFYEKVGMIMEKLTPQMQDITAEAINRDLQHLMKESPSVDQILSELDLCYGRWIK